MAFLQVASNPSSLGLLVGETMQLWLFPFRASGCVQRLVVLKRASGQQPVGYIQNLLGGPIVFLQFQHGGIGHALLEAVDVLEIGTTKSVNRLRIISNAKQRHGVLQRVQEFPLQWVGVLHLIHEKVILLTGDPCQHLRRMGHLVCNQLQNIVVVQIIPCSFTFVIRGHNESHLG